MRLRLILTLSLLVFVLVGASCTDLKGAVSSFESQLNSIARPYTFNFTNWEFNTLFGEMKQRILNPRSEADLNSQSVVRYFSYIAQANTLMNHITAIQVDKMDGDLTQYNKELQDVEAKKTALQEIAEETIARQIGETLASLGIYNPAGNLFKITFPPVNFKLEKPLYMLIVSPRDKIQKMNSITVKQDISRAEIEELEAEVDSLNVSSLIVEIGGLGTTYPTFVIENANLRWTIDTAVHEWVHQYLAFKPLGFGYVLDLIGIPVNPAIPTINETVASIVGQEIGAIVYKTYYAQYRSGKDIVRAPEEPAFDFNREMREIRLAVDNYLAQGQVEEAEIFMKEKQQYLASNGYYIRKLNQAYFAFYGSYADSPTSVDPIGDKLKLVRKHSLTIRDFLEITSGLRNPRDLDKVISQFGDE